VIDRALLAIAAAAHTYLAATFVLTDGPAASPVILRLTAQHGVHASDVPAILAWLVGVSAVAALWMRRRGTN
jgi:hypothetical protein